MAGCIELFAKTNRPIENQEAHFKVHTFELLLSWLTDVDIDVVKIDALLLGIRVRGINSIFIRGKQETLF